MLWLSELFFFFSSRRRHTRCALVTGVQTCALPIFLEASGIAIEAALIVIFDTNSWRVLPQVVAKDEQLERAIIDAGNHYWNNHVLRGELPPYIGRPLLQPRSEEHTSELPSLMRISYAVFCLKKKKQHYQKTHTQPHHS